MAIKTRVGVHVGDTYLFFGKAVESFRGQSHWSMLAQALGDGPISKSDSHFLDEIFVALLAPDPRIWPIKAGRMVASYGDPYAGLACANNLLALGVGGPSHTKQDAKLLLETKANPNERVALVRRLAKEENTTFRVFYRNADERHMLLKAWTLDTELSTRPHYKLMLEIEDEVLSVAKQKSTSVTFSLAAVLLDMGISAENTGHFAVLGVTPQIFANTLEAAIRKEYEYRKLASKVIHYDGAKPRRSTRSQILRS